MLEIKFKGSNSFVTNFTAVKRSIVCESGTADLRQPPGLPAAFLFFAICCFIQ